MNFTVFALQAALLSAQLVAMPPVAAERPAPTTPPTADGSRMSHEGAKPMAQTDDCVTEQWFNPTPRDFVAGCAGLPILPQALADVDHDGRSEAFQSWGFNTDPFQGGLLLSSPNAWNFGEDPVTATGASDVLTCSRISVTPSGPKPVAVSVLSLEPSFVQPFIDELPDLGVPCDHAWGIFGTVIGWADCDGDQDLDLVVLITTKRKLPGSLGGCDFVMGYSELVSSKLLWLENIGHEAAPPANPYDLDHDGEVGASDISRLLLEFTN